MLFELEIAPLPGQPDPQASRAVAQAHAMGLDSVDTIASSRLFLIETDADASAVHKIAGGLLVDPVVESVTFRTLPHTPGAGKEELMPESAISVLFKPGVTDNVGNSARDALASAGLEASAVATGHRYWLPFGVTDEHHERLVGRVLSNDAIEQIILGPLSLSTLAVGGSYAFQKETVAIRDMDDDALAHLSKHGQLYLSLEEMRTIRDHFRSLDRDPSDVELETVAQTWSEHCSHKTLAGRIRYTDGTSERHFENMLKETIFAATVQIRESLGDDDWCVSVFADNAGVVTFDEKQHVCFKVETHNHPSALEPYGGANTGIGGVIRDPLGTGLGARPVCNTDVFCFADPRTDAETLPPGVLHPRAVMQGVVAGVRDYGNRMGIPTVNGAICFDERYLGNPLVYCGNVAMIPVGKVEKEVRPGDLIVAAGGRTGRDGIHGATFSSAELTEESETLSGGAVQIGNPITEKMLADVLLEARDRGLYTAVTDCGAGGFSSAVGEMGEKTGAEVQLDAAPLKYAGLSYTEIWISEAQERMVFAVPPEHWEELRDLFASEGVEAVVIGTFTDTGRLKLTYDGHEVADVSMEFLHDGRPPVIREAVWSTPPQGRFEPPESQTRFDDELLALLASPNIASKEWVIRQYDHEVQGGSVVKPLVGVKQDGPSDAAVVRPDLTSRRGLVISCGINPRYGDLDPYHMAASAIDEAIRNCVAVGADPAKIAILDNFCWGNTERPETLGPLVRAAIACEEYAVAFGTPFISGKDSLMNEFSYVDDAGNRQTVAIPSTLLISALGQIDDVAGAVTMDLKTSGNELWIVGTTKPEMGGSHYGLVTGREGGAVPEVDAETAKALHTALHGAIKTKLVRACHDLSEGGLAVAAAEMAFAGGLGAEVDADLLPTSDDLSTLERLFSESNSRYLVEVPPEHSDAFGEHLRGLSASRIGSVTDSGRLVIRTGQEVTIDQDIEALRKQFTSISREWSS